MTAWFALVFAASWLLWTLAALAAAAGAPLLGRAVFLLGVFAPAAVAIAATAKQSGGAGVGRLLARIGRWQVARRWYAFALLYFISIKLAAAAAVRLGTGAWPGFGESPWPLIAGAIVVSTWVQAGEEVGWRGFALPLLARRLGLGWASLLLGVVWALWHLPLFLLPGTGSTGQSFPVYLSHVTALSVAMAWLYWKTGGSLLLVMIMHAAVNNTTGIVPSAMPGATDPLSITSSPVAMWTAGLSWLVALVLLFQMRGADLSPLMDEPADASMPPTPTDRRAS